MKTKQSLMRKAEAYGLDIAMFARYQIAKDKLWRELRHMTEEMVLLNMIDCYLRDCDLRAFNRELDKLTEIINEKLAEGFGEKDQAKKE